MLTDKIQQCETSVFNTLNDLYNVLNDKAISRETRQMLSDSADSMRRAHFELTYARANLQREHKEFEDALSLTYDEFEARAR